MRYFVGIALCCAVGCEKHVTSPPTALNPVGDYTLIAISGHTLPYLPAQDATDDLYNYDQLVLSSSLSLHADGTYQRIETDSSGLRQPSGHTLTTYRENGTWTQDGPRLVFARPVNLAEGGNIPGTATATSVTISISPYEYRFTRQ